MLVEVVEEREIERVQVARFLRRRRTVPSPELML